MRALHTGFIGDLVLLPVADELLLLLRGNPPFMSIAHRVGPRNDRERDVLLLKEFLDAVHFHLVLLSKGCDRHRFRRQASSVQCRERPLCIPCRSQVVE
jgi:hypothetical protein